MVDTLHKSCDNLVGLVANLKTDLSLLRSDKIINAYLQFDKDIEKLEKLIFHFREKALDLEGEYK